MFVWLRGQVFESSVNKVFQKEKLINSIAIKDLQSSKRKLVQQELTWFSCPFRSHYVNTRRKLLCLILVASLALLSIVLISEQLISRHVHRSQGSLQVSVLSNIFLCHWRYGKISSSVCTAKHFHLSLIYVGKDGFLGKTCPHILDKVKIAAMDKRSSLFWLTVNKWEKRLIILPPGWADLGTRIESCHWRAGHPHPWRMGWTGVYVITLFFSTSLSVWKNKLECYY